MPATELITGMEELVNHIRELEEENQELQENLTHTEDNSWDYYGELLKLREENKKLKKKFEVMNSVQEAFRKQLRAEMDLLLNDYDKKPKTENEKLKEENKKLIATIQLIELEQEKEMRACRNSYEKLRELTDAIKGELSDGPLDYEARNNTVERIRWIKKQNNKLREENKKLKEA